MYTPLRIPPGVYRNGTVYQSKGRWYDANLVRWSEGVMAPIGGWEQMVDTAGAGLDVSEPIRGLFSWRDDADAVHFLYGTPTKLYHFAAGTETDVTPAVFTTGGADSSLSVGNYDIGNYDIGAYGEGTEASAVLTEAQTWQFDNYAEIPVACAYSDGKILDWDLNVANNFAAVANAPTGCRGVVVTPERMIVALAAGGAQRYIKWCDQDDRTVWTPSSSNTAGDWQLPGSGQVMCGRRLPQETLILTDVDAFAMRYVGGTLIYRVQQVGANCGVVSRQGMTIAEGRAFWMGKRGFFMYEGGFVKPIRCEISDDIFRNLNFSQRHKVASWTNSQYHEVWFSYPTSTECDRIVCYNYMEDHWSGPWQIERSAGADAGAHSYMFSADAQGQLFNHEVGTSYLDTDLSTALTPFAESGPVEMGNGDQVMTVRRYIPDELTVGDVGATLFAALYPTASEDSQVITVGSLSDVRLTGRQIRIRIDQVATGWRFGVPRLEVVARGRR